MSLLDFPPLIMGDKEKGGSDAKRPGLERGDEGGAAKLWAVYVSEAEKYDKSLVESWKSDMEGMLIFAGLFSASLTAFLIESYKTLSPDTGEQTIRLLAQISQQLASGSNGTSFTTSQPTPPPFRPSTSSLVCNALWFISLGLSLSCALIATLLEQWARDFIHRADTRSAPLICARIYSYLYYGMKRFNMHAVVDAIPLLLHASLLFFLAGLIAFLIPVNFAMTIISVAILCLVAMVYSVLTFLPLGFLDCPYHTPLSGTIWRLLERLKHMWHHSDPSDLTKNGTMFEAMARAARRDSTARQARDYRALVWTVKSLADNFELEPFVAALADALWDRTEMRPNYADHLRRLTNHPELQLRSRIDNLYESCYDGITSTEASQRRRRACCKALWAISSLSRLDSNEYPPVDFSDSRAYHEWRFTAPSSDVDRYTVSAGAMMKWSTFCSLRTRLIEQAQYLASYQDHPNPDFMPITSLLRQLSLSGFHVEGNPYPTRYTSLMTSDIPRLLLSISDFCKSAPHTILFEYIRKSAILESPPYQWEVTTNVVSIDRLLPFLAFRHQLEWTIESLLHSSHAVWSAPSGFHWNDTAIAELCAFWRPQTPIVIPSGIIIYLNHRKSHAALERFLRRSRIPLYLWSCFPITLSHCLSMDDDSKGQTSVEDLLKALWTLTYLDDFGDLWKNFTVYESLLGTISAPELLQTSSSIIALMKNRILNVLPTWGNSNDARIPGDFVDRLRQTVLPLETPSGKSTELTSSLTKPQIEEAKFHVFAEFLIHCTTNELPHNAVETLQEVANMRPTGPIHTTHQVRLVNAIQAIGESESPELMNTIVASTFLDVSEKPHNLSFQWLDDRQRLGDILSRYRDTLGDSANTRRLRKIIKQLTTP
ncbi:hypothetical protein C8F04DRAFT_1107830 [Mycena alexandri]|uniref:DUF6535 domain-containing protein n=1 Tax=Mycena alexandri TaxID=1745969 RepID=A0AAD6SRV5_9AGAR|nr:hypothetical protein C8F04DRAFT_1107830 [Mycena alexandri]